MKLQKIDIINLFDQFDYEIPFQTPEDLLILTAPNGYGKTMILNIIDSLFNRKFLFFYKLVFEKITMWFDNENRLEIVKKADGEDFDFFLYEANEQVDFFSISNILKVMKEEIERRIVRETLFRRINEKEWIDISTNDTFTNEEINVMLEDKFYSMYLRKFLLSNKKLEQFLNGLNVYLIKEYRLFKTVEKKSGKSQNDENYTTHSVQEYAKELKNYINQTIQKSFSLAQELDSSFPKRLLSQTKSISKEEFNNRFEALRQQHAKLKKFGLSESEQEIPEYDEANAKVLLVYLADTEQKIGVFNPLIQHLELFTSILNERRFTFKTIQINKENGFHFLTSKGKELNLRDLSSGEQHEVVLLYELIFRTTPNTLVLIDEPEISLHITWQKEFLNDLLAIISLQKMQVLLATHSPSIVNSRWDLVFNLETQKMQ